MPAWLVTYLLPYALQLLTPIAVQSTKNGLAWVVGKLPPAVTVALAGVLGEALNQLQAYFTASPLPYGMSGLVTVLANTALEQLTARRAPTPVPAPPPGYLAPVPILTPKE